MIDPCEKERNEYKSALKEELEAKNRVNIPLKPLGIETPPPSNLNALDDLLEKERITKLKRQALEDCEIRYNHK